MTERSPIKAASDVIYRIGKVFRGDLGRQVSDELARDAIEAYLRARREAIIRRPMTDLDYQRADFLSGLAAEVEREQPGKDAS